MSIATVRFTKIVQNLHNLQPNDPNAIYGG